MQRFGRWRRLWPLPTVDALSLFGLSHDMGHQKLVRADAPFAMAFEPREAAHSVPEGNRTFFLTSYSVWVDSATLMVLYN